MDQQRLNGIKERFTALWKGEYQGRPLIHLRAKKDNRGLVYKGEWYPFDNPVKSMEDFYLNSKTITARHRNYIDGVEFFGEAYPRACIQLGPGTLAGYHGSPVQYRKDTIWFEEFVHDWDKDFVEFSEDNEFWQMNKSMLRSLLEEAQGEYMIGLPDLNAVSNAMALLRGTGELCLDMVDRPDVVKKYTNKILDTWSYTLQELYKISQDYQDGYSDWMGLWAPDLGFHVQSDFSTMLSPQMYDEFILPEIVRQCREVEYSCYHLDGPACVRHLDSVLGIDDLKAVQWVPGASAPPASDPQWHPMMRRIQESGRFVFAYAYQDEIIPLAKELDNDRLFIFCMDLVDSPEVGQQIMDELDEIYKQKKQNPAAFARADSGGTKNETNLHVRGDSGAPKSNSRRSARRERLAKANPDNG